MSLQAKKCTGTSKMNDPTRILIMYLTVGGLGTCLLSMLMLMTISFPKMRQIEDLISGPERSIMRLRLVWGDGPYGRVVRSSYILAFLLLQNIPVAYFQRSASQIGDPDIFVPFSLKIWSLAPSLSMYLGFFVACIAYQFRG